MGRYLGIAAIIAIALIVAGYLAGGRYELVHSERNELMRLDRLTGEVTTCRTGAYADPCADLPS